MKKILFVLSAAIFFASCKKDSSVTPDPTPGLTKKLVQATYVYDNYPAETNTFTYDGQGRVSLITEDDRTSSFDYSSPTSLIVTERKRSDNSLLRTKECTLNEKGYITKILFKDPAGIHTYTYNYTYNAEGYMIRQEGVYTNGGSGSEFEYTIVDGNLVASKLSHDGVLSNNAQYIVDPTKFNKAQFSYGGAWSVTKMFGKPTKNLLKEYKAFNSAGTLSWHFKCNYEMDVNGYPAKLTTDYILDGTKAVDTYVFQ